MSERLIFNGVHGRTGKYLAAPETEEEFARKILEGRLSPSDLRDYRWRVEQQLLVEDPNRALGHHEDPRILTQAGWGVIFAPGIGAEIESALERLLQHRKKGSQDYFRTYRYRLEQTKDEFLAEHTAKGADGVRKKVPYYLLIVGSPAEISFRFQYQLDVPHAVGRIHFDSVADYSAYADNVVDAELAAAEQSSVLPPKSITLFGASNEGDEATCRSKRELLIPLSEALKQKKPAQPGQPDQPIWPVELVLGSDATRDRLRRLMGGAEAPALLLTASHGVGFSASDPQQESLQGGLLCQDWPGPGPNEQVLRQHYFAAEDVVEAANLRGRITFHFACYSAGTPDKDSVGDAMGAPPRIASRPFLASLAKRVLSHPRGALAFIGHVDRAWTTSFSWSEQGQIDVYENTFKRLIDGFPVGFAMEYFNLRYADMSVQHSELSFDRNHYVPVDAIAYARSYRGSADARNFVVLGDPAVRLAAREV